MSNHLGSRPVSASAAAQSSNWRQQYSQPRAMASDNWRRRSAPAFSSDTSSSPPCLRKINSSPAAFNTAAPKSEGASPRGERCTNVQPGQIVFLPPREQINKSSKALEVETHSETFGHPAVVSDVYSNFVVVKPVTSLAHRSLFDRFEQCRDRDIQYKAHMLIEHPKNTNGRYDNPNESMPTLHFRQGANLEYPSYVRLDKDIPIEPSELQRYFPVGAKEDMILDCRSVTAIKDFKAPQIYEKSTFARPQADTNQVSETDLEKLRKRAAERAAKSRSLTSFESSSSTAPTNSSCTSEEETSTLPTPGKPTTPRKPLSGLAIIFSQRCTISQARQVCAGRGVETC